MIFVGHVWNFCWSIMEVILVFFGSFVCLNRKFYVLYWSNTVFRWSGRGELVHVGRKWKSFSHFLVVLLSLLDRKGTLGVFY